MRYIKVSMRHNNFIGCMHLRCIRCFKNGVIPKKNLTNRIKLNLSKKVYIIARSRRYIFHCESYVIKLHSLGTCRGEPGT